MVILQDDSSRARGAKFELVLLGTNWNQPNEDMQQTSSGRIQS
jgi:hypothetical protein